MMWKAMLSHILRSLLQNSQKVYEGHMILHRVLECLHRRSIKLQTNFDGGKRTVQKVMWEKI